MKLEPMIVSLGDVVVVAKTRILEGESFWGDIEFGQSYLHYLLPYFPVISDVLV